MGLDSRFGLEGDFDISVDYSIRSLPRPEKEWTNLSIFIIGPDGMAAMTRTNNSNSGEGYSMWFQPWEGSKAKGTARNVPTQDKAGTLRLARLGKELALLCLGSRSTAEGDRDGRVRRSTDRLRGVPDPCTGPRSRRSTSNTTTYRSRPTASPSWSSFHRPETACSFGFCLDSLSSPWSCSSGGGFSGGAVETGVDDAFLLERLVIRPVSRTSASAPRRDSRREKPSHQERSALFVASRNHKPKAPILSLSDLSRFPLFSRQPDGTFGRRPGRGCRGDTPQPRLGRRGQKWRRMALFRRPKAPFARTWSRVSKHKPLSWLLLCRPTFLAPESKKNVGRHFLARTLST